MAAIFRRNRIFVLLIICFVFYIFFTLFIRSDDINKHSKIEYVQDSITLKNPDSFNNNNQFSFSVSKSKKNPALIIDTPGCKIPKLDPFDPTVKHLIQTKDPLICSDKPLFMTAQPNGTVHLNVPFLEKYYNATPDKMQCYYQGIIRKHDKPGDKWENNFETTEVYDLKFNKYIPYEYLVAKCFFENNYMHEQYIPLVVLKKEVEDIKSKIKPTSPLNVILLGIDSVSKLNFMRHFKHTKAFLKKYTNAFDMKGYTKVGDNTFPNLMAMLTGHFFEHFWNETLKDTFYFDNVSFIWKDFAKNGYRTFYAEENPYIGTFNYMKKGFYDPPTDYYYRPLAVAIELSELRQQNKSSPCLNAELETELIYDYLENFVITMAERPFFAFSMISTLTHDDLNSASYADPPTERLLQDLRNNGAFNSSVIVIFSDHGLRFGEIRHTYVGKIEERMPFMYIHFPKWFLDQHLEFERNLAINQERLMTLFDLHATLKHLLHSNEEPLKETDELGLSLLHEIPESRTCDDASIMQHWCPCNNFENVSVTDPNVLYVSQVFIDHINELLLLHADVCATLAIAEITDARLGKANDILLKLQRPDFGVIEGFVPQGEETPALGDYLITLKSTPGDALFEGTIRYNFQNSESKVLGISRINMYGKQSWCIESPTLRLYCYCKIQQD